MKYTSAEANKLLREKNDLLKKLQKKESMTSEFVVSLGEDPESVRPEYDYNEMKTRMGQVEKEIRRIKHAINVFNSVTVVPEFDMTIDEMLVYIPQLTAEKTKLEKMSSALPKQRREDTHYYRSASSNLVEYVYANYDIAKAEEDYQKVSRELARAQTALDVINNSVRFELEV
ncbi:MAG: hypothetical protein IJM27_02635 [Eubacterium sp.]|nr:hypothetical protein [Eubacterium sp.]